tara:strand:- start:575 stop:781 length:207 start_codon:yes stop_codon:yes gene_type:complete
MKIYSEIELREMISNLRLVKEVANEYELQDESEIDLTTYELLLENHLNNKYKEIDKWLNKNGFNKLLI